MVVAFAVVLVVVTVARQPRLTVRGAFERERPRREIALQIFAHLARYLGRRVQPADERVSNRSESLHEFGPIQEVAPGDRVLELKLLCSRALRSEPLDMQRTVQRRENLRGREQTVRISCGRVFGKRLSERITGQPKLNSGPFDAPAQRRSRDIRLTGHERQRCQGSPRGATEIMSQKVS